MASNTTTDKTPPSTDPENDSQEIVLHVLCPTLPWPNRFTFDKVTLSTTIAALKSRISESIPRRPPATSQRLIYGGKPITNDDLTLRSVLEPVESTEYSIHLVLPPVPVPHTSIPPSTGTASTEHGPQRTAMHQNPLHAGRRFPLFGDNQNLHGTGLNTSGMRFRGPAPPPGLSETDIGLALRRNMEAIRQQLEQQRQGGLSTQSRTEAATAPLSNPVFSPQNPWQRMPHHSPNPLHLSPGQSTFSTTTHTFTTPHSTAASGSATGDHSHTSTQLPEESRMRLQILQAQIALCESQLSRGNAPAMEHIVNLRTQLLNLLDEQFRNPLIPRDGVIASLLSRVFNLYNRADQLHVAQSRSAPQQDNSVSSNPQMTSDVSRAPLHLLTSPDGYQAIVASPSGTETIQTLFSTSPMQTAGAAHDHGHPQGLQPNPDPALLHNVVRQAVLNQPAGHQAHIGFARHLRRVWLFMRLYFFCYMFSDPGTWMRIILVTLAVLASLLSETGVPQQLYQMIVTPVQRHIESLVQIAPDRNTQPEQRATDGTAPRGGRGGGPDMLRRMERSVALFIASLVPGVGERHVEVRNAAEAAERARAEEQRRQDEGQEGNAAQQPADESNRPVAEGREEQATTDHDSQHDTPGDEGRGQRQH